MYFLTFKCLQDFKKVSTLSWASVSLSLKMEVGWASFRLGGHGHCGQVLGSLEACPVVTHTYQLCDVISDPQGHTWKMRLLKVSFPPGAVFGTIVGSGLSTGPSPAKASQGPGTWSSQIWTPGGIRASSTEDGSALLLTLCGDEMFIPVTMTLFRNPTTTTPSSAGPSPLQAALVKSLPSSAVQTDASLPSGAPGWQGRGKLSKSPDTP